MSKYSHSVNFGGGGQSSLSSPGVKEGVNNFGNEEFPETIYYSSHEKNAPHAMSKQCSAKQLQKQVLSERQDSCHSEQEILRAKALRMTECEESTAHSDQQHSEFTCLGLSRYQLLSECSSGRSFFGTFLSTQESTYKKKIAFTLAEVLITLGIIGVVAAMTLPTLVQNYKKHEAETRLAKFYSTINQAIQRSEVDNGEKQYWDSMGRGFETDADGNIDYSSPTFLPWFDKYLRPYLSGIRVENVKQVEGKIAVYFPDGSVALMGYPTCNYFINSKDFNVTFEEGDSVGQDSRGGYAGTRTFTFQLMRDGKGLEPWNFWQTDNYLKNDATQGCYFVPAIGERAGCAALIQRNGWKIPKDYPLKF